MAKNLLTAAQVAQRFSVDRTTVLQWVREGRLIASQRLPGRLGAYLFDPDEVERLASEAAADLKDKLARLEPAGPAEVAS